MASVGVIGLGAMGSRVALRLLDAGHRVIVWNRTSAKAVPLVHRGATLATSPAEAARRADVVITMVTDPSALRSVTEGAEGIAAGIRSDGTLLEMSTVGPAAVSRLASVLPDGTGLLDAPVLGSVSKAESGSLVIFVGGPAELVERWTPLLSALGSPVHVGAVGTGAAAKLVANTTMFGVLGVFGEAVALAEALGLSSDAAFEVLATTPLGSQVERRREAIERGDYPVRFALSLACKDARLISQAAIAHGLDLRLAEAARTWLSDAEDAGWGKKDYTAVLARILAGTHQEARPT
jgi:3-hydroxyisobutyrate dehydrogenase-like beta-hydroxyacid dehydrogenase